RERADVLPDGELSRGAESAQSVAQKHADGVVAVVGRCQVGLAVVVEVAGNHVLWVRADEEIARRGEAGREAVFQDFEVWQNRCGSQRARSSVAPAQRQGGAEMVQPTVE